MYTTRTSKPMLTQQQRNHRRKRATPHQLAYLQKIFAENPKPDQSAREAIGRHIDMTPRSVQIWFQNNRAKKKHQDRTARRSSPYNVPVRTGFPNITSGRFTDYSGNSVPATRDIRGEYGSANLFNELSVDTPLHSHEHYNHAVPQYPNNRMERPIPAFPNNNPYYSRSEFRPQLPNLYEPQGNAVYRPEPSYTNNGRSAIMNYDNDEVTPNAYQESTDSTTAALDRIMLGDPVSIPPPQPSESGITDIPDIPLLPANEILKDTDDSEIFINNFEEPEPDLNIDDFLKAEDTDSFDPISANQVRSEFEIF